MSEDAVPYVSPNGNAPMTPPAQQMTALRAIDRARDSFYRARGIHSIPEWAGADGRPLEVFFTAVTAADLESISAKTPKTTVESQALLIILKARDEHNVPLFAHGDLYALLNEVEYTVLGDLFTAINSLTGIKTAESAEKKLSTTPATVSDSSSPSISTSP